MSKVLPKQIVYRKKAGFHTPIASWFRHDLRPLVNEILSEEKLMGTRVLNPGYVERLKTEHFAGQANHSYKLWGLMNFIVWFDHYGQ